MKVALDTNLIIRLIVDDDPAQADQVERLLDEADELVIATITLCEVVWVLRRGYRMPATVVAQALRDIARSRSLTLDRSALEAGLAMLERGGDFADGCILLEAERAKCDRLATFDQTLIDLSHGKASRP